MRAEPLLTHEPPSQVRSNAELYAIALVQAETAARRYGELTASGDESFKPVRAVFEILEQSELGRARAVRGVCLAVLDKYPDPSSLNWTPTEIVPTEELADFANSSLSTPYGAWALAVRHRKRGFAFWTYVISLATDDAVRAAAEDMARDALRDASDLRRERRLAWRSERRRATEAAAHDGHSELPLAALLESLLLRDIVEWSNGVPVAARNHLLAVACSDTASLMPDRSPATGSFKEIQRRAVQRAERLASIYLDEADRADDHDQLELAQRLAAKAVTRLADLQTIASAG